MVGLGVLPMTRLDEIEVLAEGLLDLADDDARLIHLADAASIVRALADVPWLVARVRDLEAALRDVEWCNSLATAHAIARAVRARESGTERCEEGAP